MWSLFFSYKKQSVANVQTASEVKLLSFPNNSNFKFDETCLKIVTELPRMFEEFDFRLLEDPSFKEDGVREELIFPLLKRLGYSSSPPNQITRSPALIHPYFYIGTKKHKVHIIPDYLVKCNNQAFFILDAKRPSENILTGPNVEQAYSYAMHKDIKTDFFALCNGRQFTLFHVRHWPALLVLSLQDIDTMWPELARWIGTEAIRKGATYLPDFGIGMTYLGLAADANEKKTVQIHLLDIRTVHRLDEETYSLSSRIGVEETIYVGTFDFKRNQLESFLQHIEPPEMRGEIRDKLTRTPFAWRYDGNNPALIALVCMIGSQVQENKDEQFIPFIVQQFF